ncbi:MAG: hypothetical protein DMF93_12680 [Acidobacteria bacterium]|nr:MAG: hypothetical protein DMF93_12680 [Acidobacteriota bacterium]
MRPPRQPARKPAGAAAMPRAASARKGERGRTPAAVKATAKKAANRRRGDKPAGKNNGGARASAKVTSAKSARGDRRVAEKTVHGGRTTIATPGSAGSASRGKYVYCIIESGDPLRFGPIGIGAEPSETVMREHTVIPMSFGTIFKTREDIVELLRSAAEAFGDVLNKMQNKLEFGLKVLWDRDQAVREVELEDEDISRLKKEISGQKGPTYFARMQYGRLIDSALQARSERYVADILEQLREVSVASRINKPIGDKMIMNAAFLISRDEESAFDTKVKSIAARFDKLTFKYTGPWPPYNFVNIRLKLEKA